MQINHDAGVEDSVHDDEMADGSMDDMMDVIFRHMTVHVHVVFKPKSMLQELHSTPLYDSASISN